MPKIEDESNRGPIITGFEGDKTNRDGVQVSDNNTLPYIDRQDAAFSGVNTDLFATPHDLSKMKGMGINGQVIQMMTPQKLQNADG